MTNSSRTNRTTNLRALCAALESRSLAGSHRLAAAFGPSMTPERLRALLAGSPMPDFLARSVEHLMGVPWHWLDDLHETVDGPARHLLVERALRTESPDSVAAHPDVVATLPSLLEA